MRSIADDLWIGHAGEARDPRLLAEAGIEAVVDLAANELPATWGRDRIYCRFPLVDGEENSIARVTLAIRCTRDLLDAGQPTLVACSLGLSRSPAIAAAVLSLRTNRSPEACLEAIAASGPHDVSPTFWATVLAALAE